MSAQSFRSVLRILQWIAIAVLATTVVWLFQELQRLRSEAQQVHETLVTPESTLEYVLTESLRRGVLEPDSSEGRYAVVVIIDSRGCRACIMSEVSALNTHWELLERHARIFYGGDPAMHLEGQEIRFRYDRIASLAEVLGTDLGPVNPITMLLADGQILDVRVSTAANPFHRDIASAWYLGVSSLF